MKYLVYYLLLMTTILVTSTVYASSIQNHCLVNINKHIINSDTALLDECNLQDNDIPALISYLNSHHYITQLYLMNNHIGDNGAQLIAKLKNIKMLELRNNEITKIGATVLARSSIHMLDLQGNKFNSSSTADLAQSSNNALQRHNNTAIILA